MTEPAISQPLGIQDDVNPRIKWMLKAGVYFCLVDDYKIFELKQGVGKWTISGLGRVYHHNVSLDPEQAKLYALFWFGDVADSVAKIVVIR